MPDKFTWMHSGQIGAPQHTGSSGSEGQMLQVLDACLVNGFNTKTVASATITGDRVTFNYGVSHGYIERQMIIISGADDSRLNGAHRVVSTTATGLQIIVVGVSQATGAITTKVAPLGFESIFGSTDPLKRAYRSSNLMGTRTVLYLDMTLPSDHGYNATNPIKRAMVSLCEDMTTLGVQINSYTDTINNYSANKNGALFWYQARDTRKENPVTVSNNSSWVIVGNRDYFIFFNEWTNTPTRGVGIRDLYAFGDVDSYAGDSDRFNCMWMGSHSDDDKGVINFSSNGSFIGGRTSAGAIRGFFIKNYDGVGGIELFKLSPDGRGFLAESRSGAVSGGLPVPDPATQAIIGMPLYCLQNNTIRAKMPRLLHLPHDIPTQNPSNLDLAVSGGLSVIAVHYGNFSSVSYGHFAIDIRD